MTAPEAADDAAARADLESEARVLEGEHVPKAEARTEGEGVEMSTAEAIVPILRIGFDLLAPNWQVTDAECGMLGQAYGPLLDKYLGYFDFGVEMTALIATALVIGPRTKKPRKEPKPANVDEKKSETEPAAG